jgi:hypothetical protein
MRKFIIFICIFSMAQYAGSQTASVSLDINNVRATVLNGGDMFNDGSSSRYEVPKDFDPNIHLHAIFAAGLWLGGLDAQQNLHLAAATYRQGNNAFQPGPVSDTEYSGKNNRYDRIFKITKNDIDNFKSTGTATAAILQWPGNGDTTKGEAKMLAPFVDLNHNTIYEPAIGDYPLIPGDMCTYTIFNDNFKQSGSLKMEVHQFVYAWRSSDAMNNTVFVSYKLINRSANDYSKFRMAEYIDYDIGNWNDDAYCSDSSRNLVLAMNGDDDDDGIEGYGVNPPAMACAFLDHKLERNISYNGDFSMHGIPQTDSQYYGYMNGFFKDNTKIPDFKCSVAGTDLPRDIRCLGVTPEFNFTAGTSQCFTLAHIYARASTGGAQASLNLVRLTADSVIKAYNLIPINNACSAYAHANGIASPAKLYEGFHIVPNPASGMISITGYENDKAYQVFEILDLQGKILMNGKTLPVKTSFDISELPNGIYFLRLEEKVFRFVKE